MKRLFCVLGLLMFFFVVNSVSSVDKANAFCLQDQYGNQYNLSYVAPFYLYGTVSNGQCTGVWPVTGSIAYSLSSPGLVWEITGATQTAESSCIDTFKLKGNYPNFEWYYASGPGGQAATYVPCGSAVTNNSSIGGALK